MKKRIFVIVLTMIVWPAVLLAANVAVTVGSVSGYEGSSDVEIPISVNDVTGLDVIAIDIVLAYDSSRISFDSLSTAGTIASSWGAPVYNSSTPGKLLIALYGTTPLLGQGDLLKLYFNVNATVPAGTSNLILTKANINEGSSITSVIQDGTFTVLDKKQKTSKKQEIAKTQEQPETPELLEIEEEPKKQEVVKLQEQPKKQDLAVEQLKEEMKEEQKSIDVSTVRVEEASETKVEKAAERERIGGGVIIREEKKAEITKAGLVASERTTVRQQEQESVSIAVDQRSEPEIELPSVPVYQQKKEPRIAVTPERHIKEANRPVLAERLLKEKGSDEIKETKENLVVAKIQEQEKRWYLPFFWKVYKIELSGQLIKPIRWKIVGRQKLPFGLRLNSKKGIISGVVFHKGKFDLKLEVKTTQEEKINLPCTLEIK